MRADLAKTSQHRRREAITRRGLTLIEMLISISIISMIGVGIAALAKAVDMGTEYNEARGLAIQHGRVALDRMDRMTREATASELFPGIAIFETVAGSSRLPETLVIWHPTGSASNPSGLPLFRELVVYRPNPAKPNELLEITAPADARVVPPLTNLASWTTELAAMQSTGTKSLISDMLRTNSLSAGSITSRYGAIRFVVEQRPSASQWSSYRAGTLAWDSLDWVQGLHGTQGGLSQTWLRTELQMLPSANLSAEPIVLFGSAALYFELMK